MGFNKVYKALLEIFPEVDPRALRAVAIEHSKDADSAVEVVLSEVIPFLSEKSRPTSSPSGSRTPAEPSSVDASVITRNEGSIVVKPTGSSEEPNSNYDANAGCHDDHVGVYGGFASGETILSEKSQKSNLVGVSDQTSDLTGNLFDLNNCLHASIGGSDESFSDSIMGVYKEGNEGKMNMSPGRVASSNIQDNLFTPESSGELVVAPGMSNIDLNHSESDGSLNTASKNDTVSEKVDIDEYSTLNTMVTQSGQICSVDLLEGIIADARSNKKKLFLAMESVINLMREVELQENAAEQAKEEAAKGGLDILSSVEDLKKMLHHAKETNDMHAGEVYGERAILATEVRELQSRLLSLSVERDKSLGILDEMHQALQLRLAAAENEIKAAEKEKLEKEESARTALDEQQHSMDKVVQEANMLKQEAEENGKLREFLIDRGREVDMLQGEISVICQDVRLLKEKFDERVPFSQSLSSIHTSCILASSSWSLKSMAPDQEPDQSDSSGNLKAVDLELPTNEQQFPRGRPAGNDHKALVDEGWEIFENGNFM